MNREPCVVSFKFRVYLISTLLQQGGNGLSGGEENRFNGFCGKPLKRLSDQ